MRVTGVLFVVIVVSAIAQPASITRKWTVDVDGDAIATSDKHVAVSARGSSCKVFDLKGHLRLTLSKVKEAKFIGGSLWVVVEQTNGDAIEEWNPATKRRLRNFYAGPDVSIGVRNGDDLYYFSGVSIVRRSLAKNQVLKLRAIDDDYLRPGTIVLYKEKVYFAASHEVYGLSVNDFDKGWRSYCDLKPETADAQGIICSGGLFFALGSLGYNGRLQWRLPKQRTDRYVRDGLQTKNGMIYAAGVRLRSDGGIISPLLYGIRRRDGKELWVQYLAPGKLAITDKYLVVLAGYRKGSRPARWDPYSPNLFGLNARLELRDLSTGRLRAKTATFDGADFRDMAARGSVAYVLRKGHLTAYQIR